jgi:hypothetical protein
MPRFLSFLFVLLFAVSSLSYSQQSISNSTAEDSIKVVINNFFAGMKNADTTLVRSTLSESILFNTILADVAGNARKCEQESVADFLISITKYPAGQLDEQIVYETIKIDQMLATVWTPYKFYFKGKFSHCGVNCFQLLRYKEGWKIQNIIDTRRRQPCQ